MKDLIANIFVNYEDIQRCISRMELDLLPDLLKRRTGLFKQIGARLDETQIPADEARNLLHEANRQNTQIQARLRARADAGGGELKKMRRRNKLQKAYRG